MTADPRIRRQQARDREIAWMAAALINARYDIQRFEPMLNLVRDWPDSRLGALADRLAPIPGTRRDRQASLTAIERIFCGETALRDRIGQISREVASVFGGVNDEI
jgi:hypothetical protein